VFHLEFNPPKKQGVLRQVGGELYQRSDDTEKVAGNGSPPTPSAPRLSAEYYPARRAY
jgi:adenylate kinase